MNKSKWNLSTIVGCRKALQAGEFSAAELTGLYLERIRRNDSELGA